MSLPLWTSEALCTATHGKAMGKAFHVHGVSIDSRSVKPGDLFIAIVGETHDGHDHAAAALLKGADGLLLSRPVENLPHDAPVVLVKDTLTALNDMAKAARARNEGVCIGVTGSVGKTTAKEMLLHIASAQTKSHASGGNLNNHIGLPLSLARFPEEARYGIFEMGMNHPQEITPLTQLLQPQVALITTIGTSHIENFAQGQIGIALAKAEIASGLTEDGTLIVPHDTPYYELLLSEATRYGVSRVLSFGATPEADGQLLGVELEPDVSRITARIGASLVNYTLPLPGEHMAMNSVAALLTAHAAGLDLREGAASLATLPALKGRGLKRHFGAVTVLDECYNASPLSMLAAIRVLGQQPGRRLAALGQMNELGETAQTAHAELAEPLLKAEVEKVFCCGEPMKALWDKLPPEQQGAWAPNAKALAPLVAAAVRPGDVLLIKGSRGEQVEINGVMSAQMAQVMAAVEASQISENGVHAA